MAESQLWVDPTYPRFTRVDLVRAAAESGHPTTESALRDWQRKGLLPDPARVRLQGTPKGGSRPGLWSANQRGLFLDLLEIRDLPERRPQDLSILANHVVWAWLFRDATVEVPQVHRAVRTWSHAHMGGTGGGTRSRARLDRLARSALRPFVAPVFSRRRFDDVATDLADLFWSDDQSGMAAWVGELASIMDPGSAGRVVGPTLAPADVDGVARMLLSLLRGAHAVLVTPDELSDRDWGFVRWHLRNRWASYLI